MKPIYYFILSLLLLIFVYWLTFIDKIGLHADEAWMGLDGIGILNNGITKPYGITNYTGILQSLVDSVVFKFFGIGVVSLRLGGIICNIVSLVVLVWFLIKRVNLYTGLFFLLLIAQSTLFLCYSKIAWEVCSFSLLFISISIVTLYKSGSAKGLVKYMMHFVFLLTAFLGVYNHIIFSSFLMAIFIGLFMWMTFEEKEPNSYTLNGLFLTFLGLFNAMVLYVIMNSFITGLWEMFGKLIFIMPLLIFAIEIFFIDRISSAFELFLHFLSKIKWPKIISKGIPLLFLLAFLIIHAVTLFQILSQEIIFIRVFSYELNTFQKIYLWLIPMSIFIFSGYHLVKDLRQKNQVPLTYLLIAYMGILCIYTQGISIRYFIILTLLLFLYISFKLSFEWKMVRNYFLIGLVINVIFIQALLWDINLDNDRKVSATTFKIKFRQETSAHFLNFSPVLNFIQLNKIGKLKTPEPYFIGYVFKFYKFEYNQIEKYQNTMEIEYDYKSLGSGYKKKKL